MGEYYSKAGGSAANTMRGLAGFGIKSQLVRPLRSQLGTCVRQPASAIHTCCTCGCPCAHPPAPWPPQLGARGYDEWGVLFISSMKRAGVDVSKVRACQAQSVLGSPAAFPVLQMPQFLALGPAWWPPVLLCVPQASA